MAQKSISIKEIAKMANVSVATVSRVINNNGRFSKETKEKCFEAWFDSKLKIYKKKLFKRIFRLR